MCDPPDAEIRLVNAGELSDGERRGLILGEREPARLILLAVDDPAERAELAGIAAAVRRCHSATTLAELAIRARRLASLPGFVPREREAGPVTLDLIHRDGRVGQSLAGFAPARIRADLAAGRKRPAAPVTRPELLRDVWRLRHEPETNSVQVHVSRLRSSSPCTGSGTLVATDPAGGYRLAAG